MLSTTIEHLAFHSKDGLFNIPEEKDASDIAGIDSTSKELLAKIAARFPRLYSLGFSAAQSFAHY